MNSICCACHSPLTDGPLAIFASENTKIRIKNIMTAAPPATGQTGSLHIHATSAANPVQNSVKPIITFHMEFSFDSLPLNAVFAFGGRVGDGG
jgi:hypothetical protein